MPLRPDKIKFSDRDPSVELAITEIAGHLTFTPSTVTAWYWLPEVRWAFRPDAEREALLVAISEQYAGLAGFRLHLRRTTRPFPADEWARTVDSHTPRPLPDVAGAHLLVRPPGRRPAAPAVGQPRRGPDLPRRHLRPALARRHPRRADRCGPSARAPPTANAASSAAPSSSSTRCSTRSACAAGGSPPQELEWLLYRSVALVHGPARAAAPRSTNGQWETGDLLALTEQIERYRTPVRLDGQAGQPDDRRGTARRRALRRPDGAAGDPRDGTSRGCTSTSGCPWPMELSSRIDILGSGDSFRNLEHRLRMIRSQQLDYAEHGIDAPPELERLAKRALVIGDEMTTGLPVDSARAHGWHRIAVGGAPARSASNAPAGSSSSTPGSCASPCSTRRTRTSWPASSSPASPSPTPATSAGCRSSCSPPRCPRPRPPSATGAAT